MRDQAGDESDVEADEERLRDPAYMEMLISRATAGDEGAKETLLRLHKRRIFRLARRLTQSREDAEELAVEASLRVFKNMDTFVPKSFGAWVYRITTNLFRDRWRKTQKQQFDEVSLSGPLEDLATDASRYMREIPVVAEAIGQLAPELHLVISAYFYGELDVWEIADAYDIPQRTVESRLHQALKHLRATLRSQIVGANQRIAEAPRPGKQAGNLLGSDILSGADVFAHLRDPDGVCVHFAARLREGWTDAWPTSHDEIAELLNEALNQAYWETFCIYDHRDERWTDMPLHGRAIVWVREDALKKGPGLVLLNAYLLMVALGQAVDWDQWRLRNSNTLMDILGINV